VTNSWKRREVIGDCTLYLGNCLEVMPTLEPVDAVVTSPPYNCGKDYGEAGDNRSLDDLESLIRKSCFSAGRISIVNVGQYIGSRGSRILFRDLLERAAGGRPVDEVIWDKGPANGAAWGNYPNSPRIRAQHESVFVYGNPKMPNGNGLSWAEWSALTTSIWRISPQVDLKQHPAMMPVEVARRCIALWADQRGTILDPFMGSGTTGVACVNLGRKFIGIELEPKYFDIACKRIEETYKQPRLFEESKPNPKQEGFSFD
jgi:site-specific DNA-methyltransferase (adenine-specific)